MYMDKEIEEFIDSKYFPINEGEMMMFTRDEVIELMSEFLAELDAVK